MSERIAFHFFEAVVDSTGMLLRTAVKYTVEEINPDNLDFENRDCITMI